MHYAVQGTLVAGGTPNGVWNQAITGTGLPIGRHEMWIYASFPDRTSSQGNARPGFSFEVLPDPSATESTGPQVTLLSVSPTYVETGEDDIVVRWRVSDASGIPITNNRYNQGNYASRFVSTCEGTTRDSNWDKTQIASGRPEETFTTKKGLVTDAIFEATFNLKFINAHHGNYLAGKSCSLEFLTYDKWGNWTRNTFADQYTTSPDMK